MKKFLFIAFSVCMLAACGGGETALFRKAQIAADKGQFEKAIRYYSTIIKNNPENYAAYASRGLAYEQLPPKESGDLQKNRALAARDYEQAISLNYRRPELYNNLGAVYIDQGRYQDAILNLNQALMLRPNYFMAVLNRAVAYSKQGKMSQALVDFSEAERLNPHSPLLYLNRGLAEFAAGYYEAAAQDYSQLIDLQPDSARAYLERGRALMKMEAYQNALEDFQQAIALSPNYAMPYFYTAELLFNKGETDQALSYAERAKLLAPNYAPAYEMMGDMLALESPVEATQHYLAARRLDPQRALRYQGKIRLMTTEAGRQRVVADRFYDLNNQR